MRDGHLSGASEVVHRGWQVTLAGMGINLALGVLYTWSVISAAVPEDWGWDQKAKSWPYMVACLVFGLMMVPAGRMQDRIGPRWVAMFGGLLVGAGMILSSLTTSYFGWMIGFGLLTGAGIGFGYASATPPAVKWFPATRTGLISGLVVAGFGFAAVYASPLAEYLTNAVGISQAMLILGIAFLCIVCLLAQLLIPPPKGFTPGTAAQVQAAAAANPADFSPAEMLRTPVFYILWFMFFCGAGAGLMIIAKLKTIGTVQTSIAQAFILVAACAVGNGFGRIILGSLSDKIGKRLTLFLCYLAQAALMVALSLVEKGGALDNFALMLALVVLIGANYGANLAIFPSMTKKFYGLKNFGVNYGLVFTSWGVGAFVLAWLIGWIYDSTKSFTYAYYIAAGLLVLAAAVTFTVARPKHPTHHAE
jgi:nitrate/nitrite transporter NarK